MSLEDGRGSAADNADGITRRRHAGWTEKAGDATMLMAHLRPAGRCPRPTRPARPGTRRVMRSTKRADAAQPPTTRTASRTRHRAGWTKKADDTTMLMAHLHPAGRCPRPTGPTRLDTRRVMQPTNTVIERGYRLAFDPRRQATRCVDRPAADAGASQRRGVRLFAPASNRRGLPDVEEAGGRPARGWRPWEGTGGTAREVRGQ